VEQRDENEDTDGRSPDNDQETPFLQAYFFHSGSFPPHVPYPAAIPAVSLVHRRE